MTNARLLRIASPLSLLLLLPLAGCWGRGGLPPGESYRAGMQVLEIGEKKQVEIREGTDVARGTWAVDGDTVRVTTDRGKVVLLRKVEDGLEGDGGVVLLSREARRRRSEAIRKAMSANLVDVPAGRFSRGVADGDLDERPVHAVSVGPFRIGKFEVTQEEWESVMAANPSRTRGNPKLPVDSVSWFDVAAFVDELNVIEGAKVWRLPTEAEWEFAARGGSGGPFAFDGGEEKLVEQAWYVVNSGGAPHPVGGLSPNKYGLHDVHGNVWEWCSDWHGGYPPVDVKDPTGPADGFLRIRRGGGWGNDASQLRLSNRDGGDPKKGNDDLGFRLVRVEPPAASASAASAPAAR